MCAALVGFFCVSVHGQSLSQQVQSLERQVDSLTDRLGMEKDVQHEREAVLQMRFDNLGKEIELVGKSVGLVEARLDHERMNCKVIAVIISIFGVFGNLIAFLGARQWLSAKIKGLVLNTYEEKIEHLAEAKVAPLRKLIHAQEETDKAIKAARILLLSFANAKSQVYANLQNLLTFRHRLIAKPDQSI